MNLLITIIFFIFLNSINFVNGCHVIRFEEENQERNITYLEKQILTKTCFDNKTCHYIDNIQKTKLITEIHLKPIKNCCNNYVADENGDCKPICKNCENGYCSYPNFCVCNKGYRRNFYQHKCLPNCNKVCINAVCISPDKCKCNEGFEASEKQPFICNPICTSNCTNGHCIKPNVCECNSGYKFNSTTEVCEPECTEDCENGKCTGSNECTCNKGYGLKLGSKNICEPICSSGCPHGTCIEPERCSCVPGYEEKHIALNELDDEHQSKNISTCLPICPSGCENGICIAPGECECEPGYILNILKRCIADCNCVNGECFNIDFCFCNAGYRHKTNPTNFTVCEPYCKHSCPKNSICSLPDKCTCDSGYIEQEGKCLSSCEYTCINGICDSKNECKCNENQTKIEEEINNEILLLNASMHTKRFRCVSINNDDDLCNDSNCTIPNDKCNSGYEFDIKLRKCMPSEPEQELDNLMLCSQKNCSDGYCECNTTLVASNATTKCSIENCLTCFSKTQCLECHKGWDTNDLGFCEPWCIPLCDSSAECVQPNVCQCKTGYTNLTVNQCEPICSENCTNGYCDKPNECICLEGYQMTSISKQCEPICDEKICLNSTCISPNQCECLEGYQITSIDNNTCRCELIQNITLSTLKIKTSSSTGHLFGEAIGLVFFGIFMTFFALFLISKFKKKHNSNELRSNLIQNRAYQDED